MMQSIKNSAIKGFTLLELLVVLAIIALLMGVVGPQVMKHLGTSKTKAVKVQIEDLSLALDMYKLDVGVYPSTEQGLDVLVAKPETVINWIGPYLRKSFIPKDAWGNEYHYQYPGDHGPFDVFSYGADNTEGGENEDQDINSWE